MSNPKTLKVKSVSLDGTFMNLQLFLSKRCNLVLRRCLNESERFQEMTEIGGLKLTTLVRRAFRIRFSKNTKDLPRRKQFLRVPNKLESSGDVREPKPKKSPD